MSNPYMQVDVLAIRYNVWISGTMLGIEKKQCINSVDVKETAEGADTATIVISDPEFLFIEDNIFLEDNKIKIMLGWESITHRVTFDGYISAIDIVYNSNGIPTLTVTCMDNTHVMNRTKKNATFTNCTNADVVKKIAKQYGFDVVIEAGYNFKVNETITQSNQTDIEFINKLAGDEVYPFTARLVGNTFYYVKMGKLETPVMTLTYRKYPHEIISFSPQINKETKQVEIESSSVNTGTKSVSTTKGASGNTNSGSASSNGGTSSNSNNASTYNSNTSNKSADKSGGYTYDPKTRKWKKN